MIAADVFSALGVIPALPGARCRGKYTTFDEAAPGEDPAVVEQRHRQAVSLCERCPSLDRCRTWFEALPPRKRPHGVVAGQINRGPEERESRPRGRPRKTVS